MNRSIPVEKNKEYIIEINGLGCEGEGVGKIDNFTVFVPQAIVGEKIKVKIVKVKKNYAYGRVIEIIESSPHRIEPVCDIYNRCGGCNIQHLDYNFQLEIKKQRVIDCISRMGKLKDVVVHSTIGMKQPYRYRNKVQLPVGVNEKGETVIGFYAPRSHNIIDMKICYIQDKIADDVILIMKKWIKNNKIKPYDEIHHSGIIRHIMVRKAFKTGEVMVVIVTNGNSLPCKSDLVNLLKDNIEGICSIVQNINDKKTNVILGRQCKLLWGKDTITDYIGRFKFNISPLSFFQVNPVQTEILYNKVLEYAELTGEETVFDAYCGTGTISLFLSEKAKKVYGVEIIPEAIKNAVKNAEINGVVNTEFIVGKSEDEIPKLIKDGKKADVIVVDPPRKGCDEKLLNCIAGSLPKKIVYVSCDPSTLARDLGILNELGYKTIEIQPVDMFGNTAHVENVALLVCSNK
ncbi:23S rRNA (uracil(1939)-C(5))-methyltransferase RlmD [Haloimpatiens sp. FM7330]|uniref:23S rRNA (uracil(1939)-C(5))-methyltransferase RlmD n=1 Tax=Haloimpatiens sp. FM7330 TaxID=3298610 RepID=UPI00363A5D1F